MSTCFLPTMTKARKCFCKSGMLSATPQPARGFGATPISCPAPSPSRLTAEAPARAVRESASNLIQRRLGPRVRATSTDWNFLASASVANLRVSTNLPSIQTSTWYGVGCGFPLLRRTCFPFFGAPPNRKSDTLCLPHFTLNGIARIRCWRVPRACVHAVPVALASIESRRWRPNYQRSPTRSRPSGLPMQAATIALLPEQRPRSCASQTKPKGSPASDLRPGRGRPHG